VKATHRERQAVVVARSSARPRYVKSAGQQEIRTPKRSKF